MLFLSLVLSLVVNCGDKKKEEAQDTKPETNANVASMDADTAKGQELYAQNCATCHGESGAGDGIGAASLNPKPRNFKAPASEWKNGNSEEGIAKTLNNGIAGSPMISYKHLGDDSLKALTKYVVYMTKN